MAICRYILILCIATYYYKLYIWKAVRHLNHMLSAFDNAVKIWRYMNNYLFVFQSKLFSIQMDRYNETHMYSGHLTQ